MLDELAEPPSRSAAHGWVRTRDLLIELISRDIKLRYRGSLLGILWTLLNPLAELLVLLIVFGLVIKVNIPNFGAYLFTGLITYGWFQTSVQFAAGAIVMNREIVRRPGVPIVVLPIVTVASHLVHFILSLPILVGLLWFNHIELTGTIAVLPLLIALEFVLILAFAYPAATLNVWFRDTQHVLRIALQLLFFLTPIFYAADNVPAELTWIYEVNPFVHLIDAYRAVLLRGEMPMLTPMLYVAGFAITLLIAGLTMFQFGSRRFADDV